MAPDRDQQEIAPQSVLLVDDEETLLKAFELSLSRRMPVEMAHSGVRALEILKDKFFPVIVSDMHMPGMTGIEFIIEARKLASGSVFMLLTASRESQTAISAINDADVFCIINKPCSIADVSDFIDAAYEDYKKKASQ
ncbi:MAG: response regulator [Planctomycetota bacterium]